MTPEDRVHEEVEQAEAVETVEGRIMELRAVLDSSDVGEITTKADALQQAWNEAAAAIYAQASAGQPSGDGASQSRTTR